MCIRDRSYTGKSIQEIVDKNSITPKNVESLSITNGNLEYKDLVWLGGVTAVSYTHLNVHIKEFMK